MQILTRSEFALKRIPIVKFYRQKDDFVREANILCKLSSNENIVRYFDAFESNGYFYLKMEYIHGKTLSQIIWSHEKNSENKVMYWLKGLLSGLSYIHSNGIIHRDIKPSNIIITGGTPPQHQQVKIIDFGLAQMNSAANNFAGTKRYSSKLKFSGKEYDYVDDIWATGCVLLEIALSQQQGELDLPPSGIPFSWCQLDQDLLIMFCMEAVSIYPGLFHFLPFLLNEDIKITASQLLEHPLFDRVSLMNEFYSTNVMVVGKTGDGKSAFLKTVMKELGGCEDYFEDSAEAFPHTLSPCFAVINSVKFIDTPGLQDGRGYQTDFVNVETIVRCVKNEKCLSALLIVMNGSSLRFDLALQETIQLIIGSFRNSLAGNIGIVFTRGCMITDPAAVDSFLREIKISITKLMGLSSIEIRAWKVECYPERIFTNQDEIEAMRAQTHEAIVDITSWARTLEVVDVTETYAIPSQMIIERKRVNDAYREIEQLMNEKLEMERKLEAESSKLVELRDKRKKDPHNINQVAQSIVNKTSRDINRHFQRIFKVKK